MIKLCSWREKNNLGDIFTSLLFDAWRIPYQHSESLEDGCFVATGSLLEQCHNKAVTIWGTGCALPSYAHGRESMTHPEAKILALRGNLSRTNIKDCWGEHFEEWIPPVVLGDPGLLVTDIVPKSEEEKVGTVYIAHYEDTDRMLKKYPNASNLQIVDVLSKGPLTQIHKIARAERIISSSLHGIIFADAYNIPRMWEWFPGIQGDGFKFFDYQTTVGPHCPPGDWYLAPKTLIEHKKQELRDVFHNWYEELTRSKHGKGNQTETNQEKEDHKKKIIKSLG